MERDGSARGVLRSCQILSGSKRTSGQILPNDLFIEILEQLPVRSLVRFQCVSKYWYGLIRSPDFIDNHLLKRGRNGRMLLIRRCLPPPEQDDVLSFHDLDSPELEVQPNLSISFIEGLQTRKWSTNLHLLGPCKGIVCIMYNGCVTLCNPALREFKLLPPIPIECPEDYTEIVLGAGFGISCSGEFKVILLRQYLNYAVNEFAPNSFPSRLYTSSTNSWNQIDDPPAGLYPFFPINELFFNGACHWAATTFEDLFPKLILSFNMNTEVFVQLDLPDCLGGTIDDATSPIVLNECLAVVQHGWRTEKSEAVEIWVMREYGVKESWTKQVIIYPQLVMFPFLSWKNDEWLLLESRGQLASISFLTKETKKFEIYGVEHSMRAIIYEETLVRLDQGKSLCGGGGFAG